MIPIIRPVLDEREVEAVRRPLESGWVTQGPEVKAFEEEFADVVEAQYACAVSSCTAALHLALRAVGVGVGDEVTTVSHSFIATSSCVRYLGAIPVFVDIDPLTYNVDPERIEASITERTKAILCVHQMGMPCDLRRILEISRQHGLPVVEDAACAIGSEIRWNGDWQRVGRPHGDVACFSFHPRKILTTGDGGILTTRSSEYDDKFRLWRQHGMSISASVRHSAGTVGFEAYPEIGYNYRMTDIQAAIGRVQLQRLGEMLVRRRELARRYTDLLKDVPGVVSQQQPPWARSNWQSFCIRLPAHADQRRTMQTMLDREVATRRGIMCAHREPSYRQKSWCCEGRTERCGCAPGTCRQLRESERAQDESVIIPLYHQMTESDQDFVIVALKEALRA